MKLIQLNIWQGRLMYGALRFLEREQADILCLQEVTDAPHKTHMFDVIQDIQSRFAYPHVFFSPFLNMELMGMKVPTGNGIFSRLPFQHTDLDCPHGPILETYRPDKGDFEPNNIQIAQMDVGGVPLTLINTHGLLVKNDYQGDERTMHQMNMAADRAKNAPGGVIVTGDLNLRPEATSLARLNGELRNLCREHKTPTTRNAFAWKDDVVTDYIFVNEAVRVHSFHVAPDLISDHQALVLEFDLNA